MATSPIHTKFNMFTQFLNNLNHNFINSQYSVNQTSAWSFNSKTYFWLLLTIILSWVFLTFDSFIDNFQVELIGIIGPFSVIQRFQSFNVGNNTDKTNKAKKDIDSAKAEIKKAVKNYMASIQPGTFEDFKRLANGVFQAEGSVSASFRDFSSLVVIPTVFISQLMTPESLAFFVRLYFELGCVGNLTVQTNKSGRFII